MTHRDLKTFLLIFMINHSNTKEDYPFVLESYKKKWIKFFFRFLCNRKCNLNCYMKEHVYYSIIHSVCWNLTPKILIFYINSACLNENKTRNYKMHFYQTHLCVFLHTRRKTHIENKLKLMEILYYIQFVTLKF